MQAAATAFAQGKIVKNTAFCSEKYLKAVNAEVNRRLFFPATITYFPSLSLLLFSIFSILLWFFVLLCSFFFNFRHLSGVVLRVTNLYAPITWLLDNYLLAVHQFKTEGYLRDLVRDCVFPGLCPKTVD